MLDTLIRPASATDTIDDQPSIATRRGRGQRIWALLHAQALLAGATSEVALIEDDAQRMAGRRVR